MCLRGPPLPITADRYLQFVPILPEVFTLLPHLWIPPSPRHYPAAGPRRPALPAPRLPGVLMNPPGWKVMGLFVVPAPAGITRDSGRDVGRNSGVSRLTRRGTQGWKIWGFEDARAPPEQTSAPRGY